MFNNWYNKETRAEKAEQHVKDMDEHYRMFTVTSANNTKEYTNCFKPFNWCKIEGEKVENQIVELDTVSAAAALRRTAPSSKIAVLNFASYKNPGGMFLQGSSAQEEALCSESNLYNILNKFNYTYYTENRKNTNRSLYTDRALYTPDVMFIRDGSTFQVDVITCAAPNWAAAHKYSNVSPMENSMVLAERTQFIKDIAESQRVTTLVLGAWGCGVFGQDARELASLFKVIFANSTTIKLIVYAIPNNREKTNLIAFQKEFL